MSYLLGIDNDYDTPKQRLSIEKIINKYNGEFDCVTDKNIIFAFIDAESRKNADYELYKIGVCTDPVESA